MAMTASEIETMIKAAFPDAEVTITDLAGDNDHYAAMVKSRAFKGETRVQQHQMVYDALKGRMGASAKRVPTRQLPNWLVHIAAMRDPAVKLVLPELGKIKRATNAKAERVLGWAPRSNEDSIVATAESLVRLGLLKDSPKQVS